MVALPGRFGLLGILRSGANEAAHNFRMVAQFAIEGLEEVLPAGPVTAVVGVRMMVIVAEPAALAQRPQEEQPDYPELIVQASPRQPYENVIIQDLVVRLSPGYTLIKRVRLMKPFRCTLPLFLSMWLR
jgi:hypothetical protein